MLSICNSKVRNYRSHEKLHFLPLEIYHILASKSPVSKLFTINQKKLERQN